MAKTAPDGILAEQLLRLADQYDRFSNQANLADLVSKAERSGVENEVYRSSNGDCWYLVCEPGSGQLLIRHQPNRASGGRASFIPVEEFLAEGHGPQHEALLSLIGRESRKAEER